MFRKARSGFIAAAAAGFVALAASSAPAQIRVAVVFGGAASGAECAAQLNDDTFFNFEAVAIPADQADEISELNQYDAVVLGSSGFGDDNGYTEQMFAAMRQWLDDGGGIVTTGWYNYATDHMQGQKAIDADYVTPFQDGPYQFKGNPGRVEILDPNHPITTGVPTFDFTANHVEYASLLDGEAVLIGQVEGIPGSVEIAYQEDHGRSVYLGGLYLANVSGYNNGGLRSGVQDRLFEQAVAWAGQGSTTCQYRAKRDAQPFGGCGDCPAKGDTFSSGVACEDNPDCAKKFKGTIPCQDGGPGICKKAKGKRTGCD